MSFRCIEMHGLSKVRESGRFTPRLDGREGVRMNIARLPVERWKAVREISGMLARAARDLEHEPLARKPVFQDCGDRLPVAQRSRSRSPGARAGAS